MVLFLIRYVTDIIRINLYINWILTKQFNKTNKKQGEQIEVSSLPLLCEVKLARDKMRLAKINLVFCRLGTWQPSREDFYRNTMDFLVQV